MRSILCNTINDSWFSTWEQFSSKCAVFRTWYSPRMKKLWKWKHEHDTAVYWLYIASGAMMRSGWPCPRPVDYVCVRLHRSITTDIDKRLSRRLSVLLLVATTRWWRWWSTTLICVLVGSRCLVLPPSRDRAIVNNARVHGYTHTHKRWRGWV